MSKRPLIVVTSALGALAAAYAVRRLLEFPVVREQFGLGRTKLDPRPKPMPPSPEAITKSE